MYGSIVKRIFSHLVKLSKYVTHFYSALCKKLCKIQIKGIPMFVVEEID